MSADIRGRLTMKVKGVPSSVLIKIEGEIQLKDVPAMKADIVAAVRRHGLSVTQFAIARPARKKAKKTAKKK